MLFSGGQDGSIRIWTFNDQAGMFVFTDAWTVDRGNGHRLSVTALYAYGGFLFSGACQEIAEIVWRLLSCR